MSVPKIIKIVFRQSPETRERTVQPLTGRPENLSERPNL